MCLVFTPISQGIARSGMEHSAVCPTIPCATSQPVRGRTSCSLKEAAQFQNPRIDFALHSSKDQVVMSRQKKNRRSHEVPILYLYRSSRGFFCSCPKAQDAAFFTIVSTCSKMSSMSWHLHQVALRFILFDACSIKLQKLHGHPHHVSHRAGQPSNETDIPLRAEFFLCARNTTLDVTQL